MQREYLKERRGYFLLKFAEALVKNSKAAEFYRLREILKENNLEVGEEVTFDHRSIRDKVHDKLQEEKKSLHRPLEIKREAPVRMMPSPRIRNDAPMTAPPRRAMMPPPRIPRKPQTISDVAPARNITQEIDLGKLNPYLKDRNVKSIEVVSYEDPVMVSGAMGKKSTGVKLSRSEVEEILDKFSKLGKIPKAEGLFKVAYGNLFLTAMISSKMGSTFTLRKL